MARFPLSTLLLAIPLLAAIAQEDGSGSGSGSGGAGHASDPFERVDLSKFEVKTDVKAPGEKKDDDPVGADPFARTKLEEFPSSGIEQKAAQLRHEIEMARKGAANGSGSNGNTGDGTADAFARQPVEIDKCQGKDIDHCLRERARLNALKEEASKEDAVKEEAVKQEETSSDVQSAQALPPGPEKVQEQETEQAQAASGPEAVPSVAPAVAPAIAGKEDNSDVVDSSSAPAPVVNEHEVNQGLLKIQQTIKMSPPDNQRAPAQQP